MLIATATPSHWLPGFRPLSSSRLLASVGSISRRQSRNPGRLGEDPTIPARQGLYCVSSFTHGPRFCRLSLLDTSSNVFSSRTHTHRAEPLRDGMKHETCRRLVDHLRGAMKKGSSRQIPCLGLIVSHLGRCRVSAFGSVPFWAISFDLEGVMQMCLAHRRETR